MQARAAALWGSLTEEIPAYEELCVHIERGLIKVLELHVSPPDLPTHPNAPRSLHRSQLQDFL